MRKSVKGLKRAATPKAVVSGKREISGVFVATVLAVIGLLFLFLADYSGISMEKKSYVHEEKYLIEQKLINDSEVALIKYDHIIEEESINRLSSMDYYELKSELGVKSDFSVYLVDDEGNVIPINGKTCIGSPKAKVAGKACS